MSFNIPANEFEICVSIADLVVWPSDASAPQAQHPMLDAIFHALNADIDLLPITRAYFEADSRAGRGDVHVYDFENDPSTVVALDTFNDPTDQLDLVTLYIRCNSSQRATVSELVQRFFSVASVQVHAAQRSVSSALREAIDSRRFPRLVANGSTLQSQRHHRLNSAGVSESSTNKKGPAT
jgi:hypothetical protein